MRTSADGGGPMPLQRLQTTNGRLDEFDRDMLRFVVSWAPYGGPPDDEILPRFGILSYELTERIRELAYISGQHGVSFEDRRLLQRALTTVDRRGAAG
ncbi:hypothetical protein [Mycolicibacterium sp.]|uniref:hypothetical protein n=1 Tax=Mycolicibacterium sp. TaxID=2320850 RepID=UPI0037CBD53C